MYFEVHNWGLNVGGIDITAISSSSVFLVGDNDYMQLQSYYDTPPESYIVGSLVPLRQVNGESLTNETKHKS